MKNIEITYEASIETKNHFEAGEAAFVLPMKDEFADALLRPNWKDGPWRSVENTLYWVEQMRGRFYVWDSIKDIREAK